MPAIGTTAKGTTFKIENSGSPQSYLTVDGVTSVAPARSNVQSEITDYDSTHEETMTTLRGTTLQVVYNHKKSDLGQAEMEAALIDGLSRNLQYAYTQDTPASSTFSFAGIIESITDAPALKGIISKTAVIRVQSPPVVS